MLFSNFSTLKCGWKKIGMSKVLAVHIFSPGKAMKKILLFYRFNHQRLPYSKHIPVPFSCSQLLAMELDYVAYGVERKH